jgi:anaerobic ribonucleoside-triphosphate reductase activating protein
MTQIAVSRLHFPITTLGPGRRIGVWFQGCSIRCAGCISADTWPSGHGLTTVDAVLQALASWVPAAEGITISGGEPFDQPEALRELLTALRSETETDIFVYSGYPFESLRDWLASTPGLIDALMTDPYDERASQICVLVSTAVKF